eukprot:1145566-Pelagomonas_calceolata.AAC.2
MDPFLQQASLEKPEVDNSPQNGRSFLPVPGAMWTPFLTTESSIQTTRCTKLDALSASCLWAWAARGLEANKQQTNQKLQEVTMYDAFLLGEVRRAVCGLESQSWVPARACMHGHPLLSFCPITLATQFSVRGTGWGVLGWMGI